MRVQIGWKLVALAGVAATLAGMPARSESPAADNWNTQGDLGGWALTARTDFFGQVKYYGAEGDMQLGAYSRPSEIDVADPEYFVAPARYLGNRSGLYGFSLSFDLAAREDPTRQYYSGYLEADDVLLTGGDHILAYRYLSPPLPPSSRRMVPVAVPLVPCLWKHAGTGAPVTEAEMRNVLADVRQLWIRAQYEVPNPNAPQPPAVSITILDNVELGSTDAGLAVVRPGRKLSFGRVKVGKTRDLPFKIRNSGLAPLCVRIDAPEGQPFNTVHGDTEVVLEPGEEFRDAAQFEPAEVGAQGSAITIATSDPQRPEIRLALQGTGTRRRRR